MIAAIHHHGDHATRGHYTCHVQYSIIPRFHLYIDNRWYLINDNLVEEIACPYVDGDNSLCF